MTRRLEETRRPRVRTTLGAKLALVLFGLVVGALAIVYLVVVPRLEEQLVDAKIRQLERAAPSVVSELEARSGFVAVRETVDFAATSLNARVVVFDRLDEEHLIPVVDSSPVAEGEIADDTVARATAASQLRTSGRVQRGERSFAEVAVPVGRFVLLLSAPLDDALANVRLVRRSLLVAGIVALLASTVAAYGSALGLTRRLRRLEAAADRIAGGEFDVPVEARGSDEVAELAHRLDSMRERLAHLDRARSEFIANASHELRTPLFSLAGFLELLADEELDRETRAEFLNETRAQVERLTRLATDLLDLSRLDAGQLEVEHAGVDLAAAARTVGEEFRPVAEATDHPLRVAASEPVYAVADEQRVVQIARILVENAVRHTPAGTPLELSALQADGRSRLIVRDEGPGIPPPDQEHLFERFYRARGGHASGSGLGLAIASELAARMDGRLSLVSRSGETVFTLELPTPTGGPAHIPHGNAERASSAPAART